MWPEHLLFNGPANFTGAITGLPVYTSVSLNLGNVANTAPSALPISTATQTALNLKANATDVYTKTLVDSYLATKANLSDVYKKGVVDIYLSLKANAADVYTKAAVDTALALTATTDNPVFTG